MDYSEIVEIVETKGFENANVFLKGGWTLLCVAPGAVEGEAYFLYSLGRKETE